MNKLRNHDVDYKQKQEVARLATKVIGHVTCNNCHKQIGLKKSQPVIRIGLKGMGKKQKPVSYIHQFC